MADSGAYVPMRMNAKKNWREGVKEMRGREVRIQLREAVRRNGLGPRTRERR